MWELIGKDMIYKVDTCGIHFSRSTSSHTKKYMSISMNHASATQDGIVHSVMVMHVGIYFCLIYSILEKGVTQFDINRCTALHPFSAPGAGGLGAPK